MCELFLHLLNRGIAAGWLVLAILVLRPLLARAPGWVRPAMWGLVGLRLALPVTVESGGVQVRISGFVDRVDGWVHDGRLYLRVVDYKTGRKSFDLTEIWNGMGLQMLLYLFTLQDEGEALYHLPVEPAGVLYLPAREAVVEGSARMSEEERRRLVDRQLRRHGLILDDPAVLEAMERPG